MKAHQAEFSIRLRWRVFGVSSRAWSEWLKRPVSRRVQEDRRRREKVRDFYQVSQPCHGARRIRKDRQDDGEVVSRARVGRLMKEQNRTSKVKPAFQVTTDSNQTLPVAPHHLNRPFEVSAPDTVYAGDIPSIPTREGWLYLAVFD